MIFFMNNLSWFLSSYPRGPPLSSKICLWESSPSDSALGCPEGRKGNFQGPSREVWPSRLEMSQQWTVWWTDRLHRSGCRKCIKLLMVDDAWWGWSPEIEREKSACLEDRLITQTFWLGTKKLLIYLILQIINHFKLIAAIIFLLNYFWLV